MYDVQSPHADDFINDAEIQETLAYAAAHKRDAALIDAIIERARDCKGLPLSLIHI